MAIPQTGSSVFFGNGAGCLFERYKKTAQKFFAHPYSGIAFRQSAIVFFVVHETNELFDNGKTVSRRLFFRVRNLKLMIWTSASTNLVDPHRIADKGIGILIAAPRTKPFQRREPDVLWPGAARQCQDHGIHFETAAIYERFTVSVRF